MNNSSRLHSLTHSAIEDLQKAFAECRQEKIEVHLLSAIVMVKQVHDTLIAPEAAGPDYDPEEYCCAI